MSIWVFWYFLSLLFKELYKMCVPMYLLLWLLFFIFTKTGTEPEKLIYYKIYKTGTNNWKKVSVLGIEIEEPTPGQQIPAPDTRSDSSKMRTPTIRRVVRQWW